MIRMAAAALLAAVSLASAALAQQAPKPDVADLNGTSPDACPLVAPPVRFCGTAPTFTLTPQSVNSELNAYYETPDGIQALIIVENLGRADGLTIPGLQQGALEVLSRATGQPAESHPVLERATIPVMGMPSSNFVYRGVVDGVPIVYSNTMVLQDHSISQFVTLEFDVTIYSPRHRDLHTRFLGNIQVSP